MGRVITRRKLLLGASAATLLACYANETYMESLATSWANGQGKWYVHHNRQQGIRHLEATGSLPPEFAPIRDSLLSKQHASDDVDYLFDIPVELVRKLGGFTYDRDIPGLGPKPFQVLQQL